MEKRREFVEEIIDHVLGRRAEVVNIWERIERRGNEMLFVDLEEKRNKIKI